MGYTQLTPEQIADLDDLDGWQVVDDALRATFEASSFSAAGQLVATIAAAADAADHHPDVDLRYPGRVEVTLTTHAVGGLTTHDVDLARTTSRLAGEAGAHPVD